ncbi:MAG: hypothetical protein DF168_00434 [Candidatus Moanabacter tarae]|uniref:DUF445 domain-containing protein n=1 Tax=Candidatus Moanibacter tarae TaxID=2200854 RepID=A0A2Z4ABD0_9BACT|nr:MAG: hypothetical protein DF168_00434 [Candidatus Moanabacter tarae]|tara:strand:+ start:5419 stop:6036 length:618 start_codon:yes stop_codon:yes gene_type:complete
MEYWFLISIPFFTALIGWLTNKVAIKMLFRPMRPVRIFGWDWQGLVPKRQSEIAAKTGEIVERELLGKHIIRENIERVDLAPYLQDLAAQLIDEGIVGFVKKIPLLGSFIDETKLETLRNVVSVEAAKMAPTIRSKLAEEAEQKLDISSYVESQINSFDLDQLERVVHQVANKEFSTIELLGGVLGFVVGLFQLLLLLVSGIITL